MKIDGGVEARALAAHIDGVKNATNIAELGIGLNPKSRLTGGITEVKKRLGTAHMALGDSAAGYGGKVTSDVHLDGMLHERAHRDRRRGDRRERRSPRMSAARARAIGGAGVGRRR